ncbi:peptidase M23 [Microbacterium sp. CFH 31415]|uniref:peptidase M23 n=1 Tax=Microbacterium sp. CFH 31415 TaxID=2921732 RepID=UPI001F13A6BF|nr:peptidase M23 [Microbacterium sp. CFH 31415]MCH6229658.1 peptidase M23 [Microbacterium sp. CFH 31415]
MSSRPAATKRRAAPRSSKPARRRKTVRRRASRARTGRFPRVLGIVAASLAATIVTTVAGVAVAGALVAHALSIPIDEPEAAPAPRFILPALPGVAGYGNERLANACTILNAGRDLGLDERDQTIAVMTAMGESSLRNIDYGDWETNGVTNPDGSRTTSIGLFQQQDGWGSREARLDPYSAATIFYRAMLARVPDRAVLEPTLVAHRTQVNADPQHYARYWNRAVRVVAALNGAPLDGDSIEGVTLCPAQP